MTADLNPYMQRALDLARRGEGLTRPNPPVGAVIVLNGKIVGEGYHQKAGGPHAEIVALKKAGRKACGATLYVTLEPCSTHGRTPPCTDAILESGIRKVVVGARDPNPQHAGKALRILRAKGLSVVESPAKNEASRLIEPFSKWVTTGLPFVTLKLGVTLDGKIADRNGKSRWITGPSARRHVQELRRRVDAVMVGAQTVRQDNPSLLPRPVKGRKPYRVILDTHARTPLTSQVLADGDASQTIVVTGKDAPATRCGAIEAKGATVMQCPANNGQVSLKPLLRKLGKMGILHILCEGGGQLAGSLVRGGLVDEYQVFISPKMLGAEGSTPAVGGPGWLIANAPEFVFESADRIGEDLRIVCRPKNG